MTLDELKQYLPDYLRERNLSLTKPFKCLNPEHEDTNPSMSYDRKRNIIHCFSCGKTYTLIDLIMVEENLSFADAVAFLNNKYGGTPLPTGFKSVKKEISNYEEKIASLDNLSAIRYLERERGFKHALEVANATRVKSDDNIIYFPHYHFVEIGEEQQTYTITDYQGRYFAPRTRQRYTRKGETTLYEPLGILSLTYPLTHIVICEGEIDALSILDIKADDMERFKTLFSIALSGVANTHLLEKELSLIPEENRKNYHFILALDNDKAGEDAKRRVEEILERLKYPYSTMSLLTSTKDEKITYHDINEILCEDRDSLRQHLSSYIESYLTLESQEKTTLEKRREAYFNKNTSKTHLNALLSDFSNKLDNLSIKTNYEALDTLFNGVSKGVITLGAISSLGKTTLFLQLADQLASNNDKDILYFSLEQSGKELVSKSLSRLTYLNARKSDIPTTNAKYSSSILSTKIDDKGTYKEVYKGEYKNYSPEQEILLFKAINQYETLTNRLFIIEPKNSVSLSIDDIEATIKEHIETTGNTPIVFIDYLQIIASQDKKLSDKQVVDINISNLRRICSVYNLLVFSLSSVGRGNYYSPIDMNSYKESGAIEYGSDILLGMNYTAIEKEEIDKVINGNNEKTATTTFKNMLKEEKEKYPRAVFLEVLKNRNGKSGQKIYFNYYPEFNTFIELNRKGGEEDINPLLECVENLNPNLDDTLPF